MILVKIKLVFVFLHSNASFALMVRVQNTLVLGFSRSVKYIKGGIDFGGIHESIAELIVNPCSILYSNFTFHKTNDL